MARRRLPDRRPAARVELAHQGRTYVIAIGLDPADGWIGEVFAHGAKAGSDMDGILDDACIALSLLLQHGVTPSALAGAMGRLGNGQNPASVIGAIADLLAAQETR